MQIQKIKHEIELTQPMRTCAVAPQLIATAKSIESILESASLDNKIISITDASSEIKRLKKLVNDINEARVSGFREIEELRSEFKSGIDNKIIAPINALISVNQKRIDDHNKEVRRLEIEALTKKSVVQAPIPAAIPVSKKWVYEVIDESKLPSQYKKTVVDHDKLQSAVSSGVRSIESVKIFER